MAKNAGKDAIAESLNTKSSVADTVAAQDTANPNQILLRAVVVDVLYDLSVFPDEDIEEMKTLIDAPDMLESAPRNSIIARVVTGGADKKAPDAKEAITDDEAEKAKENKETIPEKEKVGEVGVLAYPFFPPHLCMPLKPGEQVWLITDSSDIPSKVMYWMCRITEPDHIDDVNFTHGDRKFAGSLVPKTAKDKADAATSVKQKEDVTPATPDDTGQAEAGTELLDKDGNGIDDRIFGFPNGTGDQDAFTLKEEYSYEDIVNIATGYRQFRTQDVPRYTKRPGDLVIQGSNNTLICLGEERGWKKTDDPASSEYSNATETEDVIEGRKEKHWGSIDIVAGRGRYNWRFVGNSETDEPFPPAARVIKNSPDPEKGRQAWVEVNKNPQESDNAELNRADNPTEGDPDYFGDAARLLISHATNVDENFSISEQGVAIPTAIGESFGSFDLVNKTDENPSAILAKADEIRIIARKAAADEPAPGAPEINGSIRLIKEGSPADDLGAIMILPDGTIQINGSKIVLGRATADGGVGTGPGEGESQPYVRYQQLEDLLNKVMDDVKSFCSKLLTHTTPGYGAPSPQINTAANALNTAMDARKSEIETLKSDRIFGE